MTGSNGVKFIQDQIGEGMRLVVEEDKAYLVEGMRFLPVPFNAGRNAYREPVPVSMDDAKAALAVRGYLNGEMKELSDDVVKSQCNIDPAGKKVYCRIIFQGNNA